MNYTKQEKCYLAGQSLLDSCELFAGVSKGSKKCAEYEAYFVPETMWSSNGYSGLIFFRIDWFDLLEVQGTLKSLLRHFYWLAFNWGSGSAGHGNALLLS